MGGENSKSNKRKELQLIGNKANKDNPQQFLSSTIINLSNDIIVKKSKLNPENDYIKLNVLGEGAFGVVYKVKNKLTDYERAMKIINKNPSYNEKDDPEILNEVEILKTMDHPNILKIFEFYSNKQDYSIVTELCSGGDLNDEITKKAPLSEKYASFVMYQILSAINYCHKINIIHRDLKPENVLIFDRDSNSFPRVKICDFGLARIIEKGASLRKMTGTCNYIAPEVIKKKYDEKSDIWSCGVILYLLLSGKQPFDGEDDDEVMEKVLKGKYDTKSPPFDKISKNAVNLIKNLMEVNPTRRLSAENALNHPWFIENESKELYNKIENENVIKRLLLNLKSFKRKSVIQETTLAYLIHNYPDMKDIVNACKLFSQIDINNDGEITVDELFAGIQKFYTSETMRKDVEEIFKYLDMDNSGKIEYEEFVRAAVNKECFMQENVLRFAFNFFDKDGSGEISYKEIEETFKQSITDKAKVREALKQIFKEADINGDKSISFEEFSNLITKAL